MTLVLVVEDDAQYRWTLADYFEGHGWTVYEAGDLEHAELSLEQERFDLVITDLCLALGRGNQGLEVVQRACRRRPRPQVIVLTGFGSAEAEAQARTAGADAFRHKPQPLAELQRLAVSMVAAARNKRE